MTNGPCSIGCHCQAQIISQVFLDILSFHMSVFFYGKVRGGASHKRLVYKYDRLSYSSGHTSLFIILRSESGWIWQSLADKIHLHSTRGFFPETAQLLRFSARGYHCHAQNASQISYHLPSPFYVLHRSENWRR